MEHFFGVSDDVFSSTTRGRVSPELGSDFELSPVFFDSFEATGASGVAFDRDAGFVGFDFGTLMITGSKIDFKDVEASDFFMSAGG
jgi:hypothetical protein